MDRQRLPPWTALGLPPGEALRIRVLAGRAYLAVSGGLLAPRLLGSSATCLMGALGPPPLRVGDRVPIGPQLVWDAPAADLAAPMSLVSSYVVPPERSASLHFIPGPHLRPAGRIPAQVLAADRIGVRLGLLHRPPALSLPPASLASVAVVPGTAQALPNGDLMVLGPDAGTMGGYPVAGVLATADIWRLAHLAPGDRVDLVELGAGQRLDLPKPALVRPLS